MTTTYSNVNVSAPAYRYYNWSQRNTTTEEQNVDQTDLLKRPFIQRGSDYVLQVLKFSIPAEHLQSVLINNTNQSDYTITYRGVLADVDQATQTEVTGSASLPLSTAYQYKNIQNFLEAMNRTSLSAYRNYLRAYNDGTAPTNVSFSTTGTYAINVASLVHNHTIQVPRYTTYYEDKLGSLRLTLNLGSGDGKSHRVDCYLLDTAGKEVTVFSDFNITDATQTLVFSDEFYNTLGSLNESVNTTPVSGNYRPVEPFSKLSDNVSKASDPTYMNFTLKFISRDSGVFTSRNLVLDVTYDLETSFLPIAQGASPTTYHNPVAPAWSYNSTGKIDMLLHERAFTTNFQIELTPALYHVLGFDGVLLSTGNYRLTLPQVQLSSATDQLVVIEQALSTSFKINQIRNIEVRSNSIPVVGETNAESFENIISSIDVNVDAQKDTFQYVDNIRRFYTVSSSEPLNDINLSFWLRYADGSIGRCTLLPGERADCTLKFIRTDIANQGG